MSTELIHLLISAALFFGIHALVAGTPLRDGLVGALGEKAYRGLFAVASLAGLAYFIWAFRQAPYQGDMWYLGMGGYWLAFLLMLPAAVLVVAGLTQRNPTSVGQEMAVQGNPEATGILRITRHPFLVGVALWAATHVLVNGDLVSLIFFGTLFVLVVNGTFSIDRKRRKAAGADWDAYAASTSIAPFFAIMTGRNQLKIGEIGAWRLVLGLALWAGFAWGHAWIVGPQVLPF